MVLGAVQQLVEKNGLSVVCGGQPAFLCPSGGENIKKVKEKPLVSKSAKEKVQAAPKELLRRGLLTGTEKLKGQLRDAAEGGRREDTEADRAQDAVRMGARLAVDKLGRLALGKKKVRSWSGNAVPGTGEPQTGPNTPTPGPQAEPSTPHGGTEPVRIKTRDAVHDVPKVEYSRADLSRADQPMVKTKDAYLHRQTTDQALDGQKTRHTPQAGEYAQTEYHSQPVIRTKDGPTHQNDMILEHSGRNTTPGQVFEDSPAYPPKAMERGRQRFMRERAHQAAQRRDQNVGGTVSAPAERQSAAGMPPPVLPSQSVRTEAPFNSEAVRESRSDGYRPVKTTCPERAPVGKPKRQRVKSAVDILGRAAEPADRPASAARQTARANLQARQRAVQAAGGAKRAAATVDRPVARAAASALRGAVSAIRAAMAPLAAGGGAVIAVVLVLCLVAALIMSPLGILFSGEENGGQTITDAVREISQEYNAKLEEVKSGVTYDQLSITGARVPWPEVLAVYAVKTTSDPTNGQEVVTMDDGKKDLLKQVFWDMNQLGSFTSTVPGEGDEEDTTTLYITITTKTADEMADIYGFNASQRQQLAELLSDEYRELWNTVLYGIEVGSGEIVTVALSQVGNMGGQPYWSWYGFSHRVDWCAIFVSWCADQCGYIEAGAMPKFAGCVQGSRWFKERGLWQDRSYTPNPGDVIFFDWHDPDGFSGPQDGVPDHVGIVEKVENGRVYTVEGNSGNKCCQRSYPVGYYEIYGYGMLCP